MSLRAAASNAAQNFVEALMGEDFRAEDSDARLGRCGFDACRTRSG